MSEERKREPWEMGRREEAFGNWLIRLRPWQLVLWCLGIAVSPIIVALIVQLCGG